jgi:hypothetical protein
MNSGDIACFVCRNFQYPYVVFLPIVSQNGGQFPTNATIKEIQGANFEESSKYIASFEFLPLMYPKIPGRATLLSPSIGTMPLAQ